MHLLVVASCALVVRQVRQPPRFKASPKEDLSSGRINGRIAHESRTSEEILLVFDSIGSFFDGANYACALTYLAKRRPRKGYSGPEINRVVTSARSSIGGAGWHARSVANAAWGCAKLMDFCRDKRELKKTLLKLRDHAPTVAEDLKPQELANLAWALVKIQAPDLMAKLARLATQRIASFSAMEKSTLAWALAKKQGAVIGQVQRGEVRDPRAVAAAELFGEIVRTARFDECGPQDLANTAWACATATYEAPDSFWDDAARREIELIEGPYKPQNIANLVWAIAKSNGGTQKRRHELFDRLAPIVANTTQAFNPQEIGNIAWAFATCKMKNDAMFDAIAASVSTRLPSTSAQNLANIAWTYATAYPRRPFFRKIANESRDRLAEFKPQELSNLAWAFATCGDSDDELFKAVADEASTRLDGFSEQGLCNLVWAFSTAGRADVQFFDKLAHVLLRRVPLLTDQGLSNVAFGFSNAQIRAPYLFESIVKHAIDNAARFTPRVISSLVWALARSGYDDPKFYETLAQSMLAYAKRHGDYVLSTQEIANMAWAYACVDRVHPALMRLLWRSALELADDFSCDERRQLQQVVLHLKYEAKGSRALLSDVARAPPTFLASLRDALSDLDASPSASQRIVAAILRDLGIDITEEYVLPEGLSLDFALGPLSKRVGLEFDGPFHFFVNDKRTQVGKSAFKKRLLEALGWDVLHVPYLDWSQLKTTEAQRTYIKSGLRNLLLAKHAKDDECSSQTLVL